MRSADKETEQKAIEIARELCNLSDDELLNLPEIDDYDFIDDILDEVANQSIALKSIKNAHRTI